MNTIRKIIKKIFSFRKKLRIDIGKSYLVNVKWPHIRDIDDKKNPK